MTRFNALVPTEHQEQCAFVKWCRASRIPVVAIPNANAMSSLNKGVAARVMNKLKAEGLAPGFPDLFIPLAKNGKYGLLIEMKRMKGGILNENQKEWIRVLNGNGYFATVCRGFDQAKRTVENYIGRQSTE